MSKRSNRTRGNRRDDMGWDLKARSRASFAPRAPTGSGTLTGPKIRLLPPINIVGVGDYPPGSVVLTWDDNPDSDVPAQFFIIKRKGYQDVQVKETTYTDTRAIPPDDLVKYNIVAATPKVRSGNSQTVNVAIPNLVIWEAPTNVTAQTTSDTQMTLTWTEPTTANASWEKAGYRIYRDNILFAEIPVGTSYVYEGEYGEYNWNVSVIDTGGFDGVQSATLSYLFAGLNFAPNSTFAGASGSVTGGDFVEPTGYTTGFWPPDEAEVIGGAVRFVGESSNRGYLTATLDIPGIQVGDRFNFSIHVDEVPVRLSNRAFFCNDVTIIRAQGPIAEPGRYDAVFEYAGTTPSIRIGLGCTANASGDITISRPQITLGEELRPYVETNAP